MDPRRGERSPPVVEAERQRVAHAERRRIAHGDELERMAGYAVERPRSPAADRHDRLRVLRVPPRHAVAPAKESLAVDPGQRVRRALQLEVAPETGRRLSHRSRVERHRDDVLPRLGRPVAEPERRAVPRQVRDPLGRPRPMTRASATRSTATADSLVGKRLLVCPRTDTPSPCATPNASGTSQKSCARSGAAVAPARRNSTPAVLRAEVVRLTMASRGVSE
jgi:hypothetical protein